MREIADVAKDFGLRSDEFLPAGPSAVKIPVRVVRERIATGEDHRRFVAAGA